MESIAGWFFRLAESIKGPFSYGRMKRSGVRLSWPCSLLLSYLYEKHTGTTNLYFTNDEKPRKDKLHNYHYRLTPKKFKKTSMTGLKLKASTFKIRARQKISRTDNDRYKILNDSPCIKITLIFSSFKHYINFDKMSVTVSETMSPGFIISIETPLVDRKFGN